MKTKLNNSVESSSTAKVRLWQNIPCRYVFLAESSFTVFLMTYMGSISPISVAAMIKRVTVIGGNDSDLDVCPIESTYNETYNVTSGEFEWNGATQTMVLSGSSIGMLASYLISARLSQILGTLCAMFTAGKIVATFGWQGPFYLNGILALPYFISWMYLVYDSPSKHPRISEEERNFLESSKESVDRTSVSSALPHIAQLASNVLCALTSQWIRNKGYLSKLICYKVFNVIATFGPAIMMCTVPQLGCNHVSIIAVLSMAMFFNGAYYGGSFMNHLDLGENYAGSTAAFASTLSGIISFCAPLLANIITNENTLTAWNKVFYISAAVTSIPVIIFLFFGSVEEQSWNKILYKDDPENGITKDIEPKD
uniref:Inorganic phosphate cotransporter n=1 Tax=Timema monikensis TaxID=170555 RepID=A0A7R9DYZ3_9NEOP|nr:unnamed protein product [Timema monikensis]